MRLFVLMLMMTLTACTPTLAPQPVHTVNPVPVPILTQHQTTGVPPIFVKEFRRTLDGSWLLMSFDGFIFEPNHADLSFANGQGMAYTGCNTINFGYHLQNSRLIISNVTSTKMACDNPFEAEFSQFLRTPLTIRAEPTSFGTHLYLSNQEGKSLSFIQASNELSN